MCGTIQCTHATHDYMRGLDDARWEALTTHVGFQDIGDGQRLELRNCKACESTLSRRVGQAWADSGPRVALGAALVAAAVGVLIGGAL